MAPEYAALVILGLGIRGFDYSWIIIWYLILLSADFSLCYLWILEKNNTEKMQYSTRFY